MNILIIGDGGREHALGLKVLQSKQTSKLYYIGKNIAWNNINKVQILGNSYTKEDFSRIKDLCIKEAIDLVIIGPEQPIIDGLADILRRHNINVLAPNKEAARIEGSKFYAKQFMDKYNIKTPSYVTFDNQHNAIAYTKAHSFDKPLVIKSDSNALGKGVLIANNIDTALKHINLCFIKDNNKIIIEEYIEGTELSFFILCDGKNYTPFSYAKDYKKSLDGDKGLNTGGMGAYSSNNLLDNETYTKIINDIVEPTMLGLEKENMPYIGVLFFGLIIAKNAIYLLEYNVRLGDPEAQVILPRLKSDLVELFYSAATGKVKNAICLWSDLCYLTVVLAAKGYPADYKKGSEIYIDPNIFNTNTLLYANVLASGKDNILIANGGRLLNILSWAENKELAAKQVYNIIDKIIFSDGYYRKDIGN